MAFGSQSAGADSAGLLSQLNLRQKAGLLFQPPITVRFAGDAGDRRRAELDRVAALIEGSEIRHFNIRGSVAGDSTPTAVAEYFNELQDIAGRSSSGVPVTISSDPRHGFHNRPGSSIASGYLSRWPEPIAFGALDEPETVQAFADVVRQEYRALGIHVALHPQADLATDARWMRNSGTFGQDPDRVSALVAAYIRGLQGDVLGASSVACVTKHFPGGGAQRDGEDPHFSYGKDQVYPGGFFETHLQPFAAAIAAGTSQVMPYYTRPVGTRFEEVGFAFNAEIITGILRGQLGFDGIVLSDWGILTPGELEGQHFPALAWGVEHLTPAQRLVKALEAGVDQFGGEWCTDLLVELVERGEVSEERVDESAVRLLREKQALGLFDEPRADPQRAAVTVGRPDFVEAGLGAQRASMTVVKNGATTARPVLPLKADVSCRVVGFDPEVVRDYCTVVEEPTADFALVRMEAPYEPRPGPFERWHRAGRLNLTDGELSDLLELLGDNGILCVELDRPAVIPEAIDAAVAVVGFCGAQDAAVLDVVFGRAAPRGRLPFDLPRSMDAVEEHDPDRPGGSVDPVFTAGWRADVTGWPAARGEG